MRKFCGSCKMLQNDCLPLKNGFDTVENEPRQVSCMLRAREASYGIVSGLGLQLRPGPAPFSLRPSDASSSSASTVLPSLSIFFRRKLEGTDPYSEIGLQFRHKFEICKRRR